MSVHTTDDTQGGNSIITGMGNSPGLLVLQINHWIVSMPMTLPKATYASISPVVAHTIMINAIGVVKIIHFSLIIFGW